jgi:hypothetical protein
MLRFVVFIALFAVVVYAGFWLLDRRKGGGGPKAAKPIPKGPVGPDDDEDFLRELERRRRHSKSDQSKNGRPSSNPPKDSQPKSGPANGKQPKDPKAEEAKDAEPKPQPKAQPTEGKPNDGDA